MTVSDIYDEIEFLTETDSSTYPDADKLRGLNLDQGEALIMLLQARGFHKVAEKTYYTTFVNSDGLSSGDNGYLGEYSFDSNWVRPVAFYVKYPDQDYHKKCKVYDINENEESEMDQDIIQETFSELEPAVRFARDSFFIRPLNITSDVTKGIKVVVEPRQATLTTETDTPIMDPVYHRWYALKGALRYGKFRTGIQRIDLENELFRLEVKIKKLNSHTVNKPNNQLKGVRENFG